MTALSRTALSRTALSRTALSRTASPRLSLSCVPDRQRSSIVRCSAALPTRTF